MHEDSSRGIMQTALECYKPGEQSHEIDLMTAQREAQSQIQYLPSIMPQPTTYIFTLVPNYSTRNITVCLRARLSFNYAVTQDCALSIVRLRVCGLLVDRKARSR